MHGNKSKILKLLGVVMVLVLVLVAMVAEASAPPPAYSTVDIGPKLRDLGPGDVSLHLNGFEDAVANAGATSNSQPPDYYVEGDVIKAIWYDDLSGLWLADYEVKAIGEHIEVWVMTDLNFPDGDPRNPVEVTDEQIDYLVDQFDNNIYPTMLDFFGPADWHDGSNAALPFDYYDPEGRTIAMISNIGDDNYYDPTFPVYIAGFYWGSVFEYYLDRNVISIDAFDWENRVGPDAAVPHLYEGVFAHEYQHLLHDDYDSDEENFVNEGMSDLAEYLVGYGHPQGHVNAAEAYPENSLTVWGDQPGASEILADYGQAYLFQLYLMEKFGSQFIQTEFNEQANGISGINAALADFGIEKDFNDIYHDWNVAVLIDDEQFAGGRYGFDLIDVEFDIGSPDEANDEAFDSPGVGPWATDYRWVTGGSAKHLAKFVFNGVEYTINPTAWSSDGEVLWSGKGNLSDNFAIFETTGGGILSFDTMYEIEEEWDFGFVQVSMDGGMTWASLENAYTTSDHAGGAHPKVIANLPGLTGSSGGWIPLEFTLPGTVDDSLLVAFRYVTDWNTLEEGWYIDNVMVDGELISDGSDVNSFKDITEIIPINNDFTVTFVGMRHFRGGMKYKVLTMKLDDMTEYGLFELNAVLKNFNQVAFLVTYDAPEDARDAVEYDYDFTYTNRRGGH